MDRLPTRDDLLRQKALARDELDRPRQRALAIERDIARARAEAWELLDEFVLRARELEIAPCTWHAPATPGATPRVVWVEGYPLASGNIVSAPPLRYGIAERRLVRRPQQEVHDLEELTLFVLAAPADRRLGGAFLEPNTASGAGWPWINRLEHAASKLTALRRELETSLLALLD